MYVHVCKFIYREASLVIKNPPANARDIREIGSTPESGRSPEGWHGNPFQYSGQENLLDREAWQTQSIGFQRVGHD